MLNKKNKKEALNRMNAVNDELKYKTNLVISSSEDLYKNREPLKEEIDRIWNKINEFRNKTEQIDSALLQVKVEFDRYKKLTKVAKINNDSNSIKYKASVGVGVATGAGVAMLSPTAEMAIATTFGTASTGTAISSLTGIAAENAAIAWLGGGSLAAGGAGMAGGNALMGLAGPVGLSIAAASILIGGTLANSKNKQIVEKANDATIKLKKQIKINEGTLVEIENTIEQTKNATSDIIKMYYYIKTLDTDFSLLTDDEKFKLGAVVNNVLSFTNLLNKTVGNVNG